MSSNITSGLLNMVDAVREMLASIESTGADGERDYCELVSALIQLQEDAMTGVPKLIEKIRTLCKKYSTV